MSSVKILHCADLHIGAAESSLGTKSQSRRAETLITFEKIISLARQEKVDIILIAGDLFNSNNIEKTFTDRVFECFESVPDIKIVYSAGNHDPLNADSPFKKYSLPKNVYLLETKDCFVEFTDLATRVYGKSFKEVYMQGKSEFSLKPDNEFINLMCIHGELRSDLNSEYNSITEKYIESSNMDYIALGHIHKRTDIAKIGNTYLSYCGCPEGQGFDELGEKGVYIGDISKQSVNLQFVPTAKRMHLTEKVDITSLSASNEICDKITEHIKQKYPDGFADNLYKIILCGQIDDGTVISLPDVGARLNEVVYFAKLKDQTEYKIDLNRLAEENTLKGVFVKNMCKRLDTATDDERKLIESALNIGIKAFSGEVSYDED